MCICGVVAEISYVLVQEWGPLIFQYPTGVIMRRNFTFYRESYRTKS